GAGTVTGLGTATASGGVASKTVTGALAGSITITASANSLNAGTTTFAIVAGPATHLTFTSSSADLAVGSVRMLTVEVRDAFENLCTSDTRSITFIQTAGTGTVSGLPYPGAASGGIAARPVTGKTKGSVTITATSVGVTSGSSTFNIARTVVAAA